MIGFFQPFRKKGIGHFSVNFQLFPAGIENALCSVRSVKMLLFLFKSIWGLSLNIGFSLFPGHLEVDTHIEKKRKK